MARRLSKRATETIQVRAAAPDSVLSPAHDFRGAHEEEWGPTEAYVQYALMGRRPPAPLGLGVVVANRVEIAQMWSDMSRGATRNPAAWERREWEVSDLLDDEGPGNSKAR